MTLIKKLKTLLIFGEATGTCIENRFRKSTNEAPGLYYAGPDHYPEQLADTFSPWMESFCERILAQ